MKFNRTGREYYDCTSDFDVELERETSVIDFVKEVLDSNNKEFGEIAICKERIPPYAFPYGIVVFKQVYRGFGTKDAISRETVISAFESGGYADNVIKGAKANGAYHLRMDYYVLI